MNTVEQITHQVEQLPPAKQEDVLRYVNSLAGVPLQGEDGRNLLKFAGTLDDESAREMMEAIEAECEQIDYSKW